MTIQEVRRDEIRMVSGRVMHTDPIVMRRMEDVAVETMELADRVQKVVGNVGDGFIIVTVYDKIDSIYAKSETVVFLAHIESITPKWVQVDADADE